ncbi:MAG: hypothetical protein A3G24_19375 [Betaproteobacteria bacterium RIFCSPLOWO2_12_FULL_62_13]|nr:MAG: hypothetical protein A3G24_19375 [Betaproteobacteria bacterium RIFCSPLOWO2_12_FULL_62_13]
MSAALRLLSAGSIRRGVTGVIEMFERATGIRVEADFTSAPMPRTRFALQREPKSCRWARTSIRKQGEVRGTL